MSSPEFGPQPPDREGAADHELEPQPYFRTARFDDERTAAQAYRAAEGAIHRIPCDLSAYRFLLDQVSHVTVIGDPPPPELDQQVARALAAGDPTELPAMVLAALLERRRQASRLGPWIEGHHRPGWPL